MSTDTNDSNQSKELKMTSTQQNKVHFNPQNNSKLLLRPDLLIKTKVDISVSSLFRLGVFILPKFTQGFLRKILQT